MLNMKIDLYLNNKTCDQYIKEIIVKGFFAEGQDILVFIDKIFYVEL